MKVLELLVKVGILVSFRQPLKSCFAVNSPEFLPGNNGKYALDVYERPTGKNVSRIQKNARYAQKMNALHSKMNPSVQKMNAWRVKIKLHYEKMKTPSEKMSVVQQKMNP